MKINFFKISVLLFSILFYLFSCSKDDIDEVVTVEKVERTKALSEINALSLYELKNDEYVKVINFNVSKEDEKLQEDAIKNKQIFDLIRKIIPSKYKSLIKEIMIFNDVNAGGYAHPLKEDLSSFQVGISINLLEDESLDIKEVIVHELGHVLTLNNSQFIKGIEDCDTFKLDIVKEKFITNIGVKACAKENSYINNFEKKYWFEIRDELNMLNELLRKNDPTYDQKQFEFKEKHGNRFVSDYASTRFEEDIAEVFNFFVRKKKPESKDEIKNKKILTMYEDEELVAVRDFIKGNINFDVSSRSSQANKRKSNFSYCLKGH